MSPKTQKALILIAAFTVVGIAFYLVLEPLLEAFKVKKAAEEEAERRRKTAGTIADNTDRERGEFLALDELQQKEDYEDLVRNRESTIYQNWRTECSDAILFGSGNCNDSANRQLNEGLFLRQAMNWVRDYYKQSIPFGWEPFSEGRSIKWRNIYG